MRFMVVEGVFGEWKVRLVLQMRMEIKKYVGIFFFFYKYIIGMGKQFLNRIILLDEFK